jgi:MFS superfamily sulfate permease-like transporter
LKVVVFDLSTSVNIDSSGARFIKRLHENLSARNIDLKLAEAHAGVRDILRSEGIEHLFGRVSRRDSLHELVLNAAEDTNQV